MGSGTTSAIAKKLNRKFIGIEKRKILSELRKRIFSTEQLNENYLETIPNKRKEKEFHLVIWLRVGWLNQV